MKILYLNSSMIGTSDYFVKRVVKDHASKGREAELEIVDLNKEFDGTTLNSKNISEFYKDSKKWIEKMKVADKIVISASMINYNYGNALKSFLDKVVVNGVTFGYNEKGKYAIEEEMFSKKKLAVIFSSGSEFSTYPAPVREVPNLIVESLKFIGFRDENIKLVITDGVNSPTNFGKSKEELFEIFKDKLTDI